MMMMMMMMTMMTMLVRRGLDFGGVGWLVEESREPWNWMGVSPTVDVARIEAGEEQACRSWELSLAPVDDVVPAPS